MSEKKTLANKFLEKINRELKKKYLCLKIDYIRNARLNNISLYDKRNKELISFIGYFSEKETEAFLNGLLKGIQIERRKRAFKGLKKVFKMK